MQFVRFYVIDDDIDFESKQLLRFSVKNARMNSDVEFLKINKEFFTNIRYVQLPCRGTIPESLCGNKLFLEYDR